MDATLSSLASALGVPIIVYVGAELVKRSTSIGQVKIDDRHKLTQQLSDELGRAHALIRERDKYMRTLEQKIRRLEHGSALIAAEARVLNMIAMEYSTGDGPYDASRVKTDANRVIMSVRQLEKLTLLIEAHDEDDPAVPFQVGTSHV